MKGSVHENVRVSSGAACPNEPADSFCWEMRTFPWPRPSRYLRLITDLKAVHAQFHPMEKESAAL